MKQTQLEPEMNATYAEYFVTSTDNIEKTGCFGENI
jgi:hypothetical protein